MYRIRGVTTYPAPSISLRSTTYSLPSTALSDQALFWELKKWAKRMNNNNDLYIPEMKQYG